MRVLVVNTYGGSLLLGARLAGLDVEATMEDHGYGSDLQALNFPDIQRYESIAEWPDEHRVPWDELIVIGHPPCAAFSVQNPSKDRKGLGTAAFQCHIDLIQYALGHQALMLAIESVCPAYEHVCETYEKLAEEHGYCVTYLMLNAASFGVPQWRPRMWAIFHRTLIAKNGQEFMVDLSPNYHTIGEVLDPVGTEFQLGSGIEKGWQNVEPFVRKGWYGNILRVAQEKLKIEPAINYANVRERFQINGFASNAPWLLDPGWFAPVITSASRLYDHKRHLTIEEYCDIAGFPRDYRWGRQQRRFREYLSKGVAPPVAAWVLKMMVKNLEGWDGPFTHIAEEFGEVIELRPTKPEVRKALKEGGKTTCQIA